MRRRESASSRRVAGSAAAMTASSDRDAFVWEALRQSAQQQALHGEVGDGDGRDAEARAAGVCLGGRALRLDDAGLQIAGRAAAHLANQSSGDGRRVVPSGWRDSWRRDSWRRTGGVVSAEWWQVGRAAAHLD